MPKHNGFTDNSVRSFGTPDTESAELLESLQYNKINYFCLS